MHKPISYKVMNDSVTNPVWHKYLLVTAMVCGGMAGWLLFVFGSGSYLILGAVSKLVAILTGSAWVTLMAFATKVADITESPALTPDEHRRLEWKCKKAVRRAWLFSGGNVLSVILVLVPSILVDGKAPVPHWIVVAAGAASGFTVYSIVIHAWWQEELRSFRSKLRLREREKARLAEQKALFANGGNLDAVKDEIDARNRSFNWPTENQTPH